MSGDGPDRRRRPDRHPGLAGATNRPTPRRMEMLMPSHRPNTDRTNDTQPRAAASPGQLNRAAEFLPQTSDDQLPAVRVGDALVFAYWSDDGALHVSIDTTDLGERYPNTPPLRVMLNDGLLYRRTIAGATFAAEADALPRVQNLGDEELFQHLALAEHAELHGASGLDYPVATLAAEVEGRIPGALERLAQHFAHHDTTDVVRAWFSTPARLLLTVARGA